MEFATHAYGYFFLLALTGTWALRRRRVLRNAFLLVASYAFAWKFQPLFLAALVASSLWNYAIGEALFQGRGRHTLLVGIAANLALLGFFKYTGFFVDSWNDLFVALGLGAHLPLITVIAPLGVSFYTFQAIAYLVDAACGTGVRPASLLDFLLFMAFFPRFAAGPICRGGELLPQIMRPSPPFVPELSRAVALLAAGLLKKMVLGTYLATHMTEDAFQSPASWSAPELWVAVFAYTAQIYLDFSGYTDIARGSALLLGFELPENFRYPYAATSLGDFWRRWHLTFSRWLRDYLYFPLGGSRGGRLMTARNLMITFVACGLWHGATWGFIVWGALHGAGLIVERARGRRPSGVLGWALTLGFCALARIFFKAPDLAHAGAFFAGLFATGKPLYGFEPGVVAVTLLAIAMNFVGRPVFEAFVRWHEALSAPLRYAAWAGVALVLVTLRPFDVAFTIYFRF